MNLIEELNETRSETLSRFGLEGHDLDRAYGRGTWTHHLGQIALALEDEG